MFALEADEDGDQLTLQGKEARLPTRSPDGEHTAAAPRRASEGTSRSDRRLSGLVFPLQTIQCTFGTATFTNDRFDRCSSAKRPTVMRMQPSGDLPLVECWVTFVLSLEGSDHHGRVLHGSHSRLEKRSVMVSIHCVVAYQSRPHALLASPIFHHVPTLHRRHHYNPTKHVHPAPVQTRSAPFRSAARLRPIDATLQVCIHLQVRRDHRLGPSGLSAEKPIEHGHPCGR